MIYQVGGYSSTPVEIGSMIYSLMLMEHVVDRGEARYGQHDPEKLELHVDSTQPMQRQVASTLHEAIHAMNSQSHNDLEETEVIVLALQFMGFMRDNPELINDMMEVLINEHAR